MELLEHLVRLRRVSRQLPGNRDVAAVRSGIEQELGETVSQRLAGRLLGVSHTALERWIRQGDLPVVLTTSGRPEIPVPALLELYESVEADRADGTRRYSLTPTMGRQREAAERLSLPRGEAEREGHDRARARSRAYHEALARRLRRSMVDEARYVLFRWRAQGHIDDRYADRWEKLLARPVSEIKRALVADGPDADDLRRTHLRRSAERAGATADRPGSPLKCGARTSSTSSRRPRTPPTRTSLS